MARARAALGVIAVLWLGLPVRAADQAVPTAATAAVAQPAWPPEPGMARVRFTRSLDPSVGRGRPSAFSRFLKVIIGSADAAPTMAQPYGMAVGPDGLLYVVDATASVIHVFGLAKPSYRSIRVDGGESLVGITFAGRRLIVTDSVRGRVLCLESDGHVVWTLGPKDGFRRPTGITASSGRLFVVDTLAHRVVIVSTAGEVLTSFGTRGVEPGQMNYPTSIAADANGRLYVVDTMNFRVQMFSLEGRPLGAFGQLGDGAGDFDKPKGIAIDAQGLIYVVEGIHDVVKIFDPDGRLLLVFAGSGAGPGQLWLPAGIALGGSSVYVADTANHRVQVFERTGEAR